MKRAFFMALAFALFLPVRSASGQVLPPLPPGGYYINCPTRFNNIFANYGYVRYQGHEWDSLWNASSPNPPLPSLRWYKPPSTTTVLTSRDGMAKWSYPEIQVLCWIFNSMSIIAYHYDPYAFRGTVTECGEGSPGGGMFITDPLTEPGYDPYEGYPLRGECPGGSGGGDGGGATCHDEYIYVEVSYDGGVTWEVLWEGWAQVCT